MAGVELLLGAKQVVEFEVTDKIFREMVPSRVPTAGAVASGVAIGFVRFQHFDEGKKDITDSGPVFTGLLENRSGPTPPAVVR